MSVMMLIGTGPGIGFATAERFARDGFRVIMCGRNVERLASFAADLAERGHDVEALQLDASDVSAVSDAVTDIYRKHGRLDVLLYNAAAMRQATIESQPLDTFVPDLATNIGGALAAIQAAFGLMSEQGAGTILLTGGIFSVAPNFDYLSLGMGKAALLNVNQALFEPFRQKNVHIATVTVAALVAPGSTTATQIAEQFWSLHSAPREEWVDNVVYRET